MTLYRALAAQRPDAFNPALASSLNNVASCLSELGAREKALAAAQEAVTLYRALAAQRPDAFAQGLATSLASLGMKMAETSRTGEAITTFAEGVVTLTATFIRYPAAISPLMMQMLLDYLRLCEEASVEPDRELLAPIVAVFEQLKPSDLDQGATE